ncbi:MAG: hypothetical protein ACR2LR_19900 [Hassallia sp.]
MKIKSPLALVFFIILIILGKINADVQRPAREQADEKARQAKEQKFEPCKSKLLKIPGIESYRLRDDNTIIVLLNRNFVLNAERLPDDGPKAFTLFVEKIQAPSQCSEYTLYVTMKSATNITYPPEKL